MFVGFSHRRNNVVIWIALMYDETIYSFASLFKTFLQVMSGKALKTIITYRDSTMAKAISQLMLNTYYRLFIWHMMQNAFKHVKSMFNGYGQVKHVLFNFIDQIKEEHDFLIAWNNMLNEYDMHNNDWLIAYLS